MSQELQIEDNVIMTLRFNFTVMFCIIRLLSCSYLIHGNSPVVPREYVYYLMNFVASL